MRGERWQLRRLAAAVGLSMLVVVLGCDEEPDQLRPLMSRSAAEMTIDARERRPPANDTINRGISGDPDADPAPVLAYIDGLCFGSVPSGSRGLLVVWPPRRSARHALREVLRGAARRRTGHHRCSRAVGVLGAAGRCSAPARAPPLDAHRAPGSTERSRTPRYHADAQRLGVDQLPARMVPHGHDLPGVAPRGNHSPPLQGIFPRPGSGRARQARPIRTPVTRPHRGASSA